MENMKITARTEYGKSTDESGKIITNYMGALKMMNLPDNLEEYLLYLGKEKITDILVEKVKGRFSDLLRIAVKAEIKSSRSEAREFNEDNIKFFWDENNWTKAFEKKEKKSKAIKQKRISAKVKAERNNVILTVVETLKSLIDSGIPTTVSSLNGEVFQKKYNWDVKSALLEYVSENPECGIPLK